MKCGDLTQEEAVNLWNSQTALDYIRKMINERRRIVGKTRQEMESYGEKHPLLKYRGGATKIHSDFRGFLGGGGWVIYVGDWGRYYWRDNKVDLGIKWSEWIMGWNTFGVTHLIDYTDLICEPTYNFINWLKDNPMEVKG